VVRSRQGPTHFTFPGGSLGPGTVVAVTVKPLDERVFRQESPRLLLPVTMMSGLVLASPFPVESSLEIGGWTR